MGFWNTLFYVVALVIVGAFLWYIIKLYGPSLLRDIKQGDNDFKETVGKKNYRVFNIFAWIVCTLIVLWLLGTCAQNYLGI